MFPVGMQSCMNVSLKKKKKLEKARIFWYNQNCICSFNVLMPLKQHFKDQKCIRCPAFSILINKPIVGLTADLYSYPPWIM